MDDFQPGLGISAYYLESECLVFSEPRQELHLLNSCAAFIWGHFEGGSRVTEVVEELRHSFGLTRAEARRYVDLAVEDWGERGLLGNAPATGASTSSVEPEVVPELPPTPVAFREQRNRVVRTYVVLECCIQIRFSSPEQDNLVHPLLAHLAADRKCRNTLIEVMPIDTGLAILRDGKACAICQTLEELAPLVKGLVWSTAINGHDFFIGIHAGVVGGAAGCLLLPGASGSGKSTLTAALVHAGYTYFSDEFALLRHGDLHVLPAPLALSVKESGIEVLASRFPILRQQPINVRPDGIRVVYMPPPGGSVSVRTARPVAAIVFPRYVSGRGTTCQPLTKAEALRRVLAECLVLPGQLEARTVSTLVEWITAVDCVSLEYSSTSQCLKLIARMFTEPN